MEREDSMRGIATLLFLFIVFYPLCQLGAQENNFREDIIQQSKEAFELYRNAQLDEAIYKFNAILLQHPSDKEALEMREQAGVELMMQMLLQGGEISRIARILMLYAEQAPVRQETDPGIIRKLVEQAATGNLYQRNNAISLLDAQAGELAAPYMLNYLTNRTKDEERINIQLAMTKMGSTLVNPLIEALDSADLFLRQQVIMILGNIKDVRALADLKKVLEDKTEEASVKEQASIAIQKITGKPAIALKLAKYLYYEKANKYYEDAIEYKIGASSNRLQWKWMNNSLNYQEILPSIYNDVMAEDACYRALQLDPGFQRAWALLLQIYYSQKTKIESVEEAATERAVLVPEEDLKKFQQDKPRAVQACNLAYAAGPDLLYLALQDSLRRRNKNSEVTVEILVALGNLCRNQQTIVRDIIHCLNHQDKRVRYAAAQTISEINPIGTFKEAPKVMEILKEALQEWDTRVILIVDDNDASRNELSEIIRKADLVALAVNSGTEGIKRAKTFPPEDLIIVAENLSDMTTSYFVNNVTEDPFASNIPVLILGKKENKEKLFTLYSTKAQIKDIVTLPLQEDEVKLQINKVLDAHKKPYKVNATDVTLRSLQVMTQLAHQGAIFSYMNKCIDVLTGLLEYKTDEKIIMLTLDILGNIGDAQAITKIEELLVQKDLSYKIRNKTAWALGQIFAKSNIKPTEKELEMFVGILNETPKADTDVTFSEFSRSIYQLLGHATMDVGNRRALFMENRVQIKPVPIQLEEEEPEEEEEVEEEIQTEDPDKEQHVDDGTDEEWGDESEEFEEFLEYESSDEEGYEDEELEDENYEDDNYEDDNEDDDEYNDDENE